MIYVPKAQIYQEAANSEPQPQIAQPPQEHLNPCLAKPLPNIEKRRIRCHSPSPLMLNPFSTLRARVSKFALNRPDQTGSQNPSNARTPEPVGLLLIWMLKGYAPSGFEHRHVWGCIWYAPSGPMI